VDQIERRLAANACIGSLDLWQRDYWFRPTDPSFIDFVLREAGVHGFKAERTIHAHGQFAVDDRAFKFASGRYDVRSARLTVEFCGENTIHTPS